MAALAKRRLSIEVTVDVAPRRFRPEIKKWSFESCLEKDFDLFETLGRGSVGVVRRARRRSDGLEVALKIVPSMKCELVRLEYAMLKSLDHPHIIKCHGLLSLESMHCDVLVFEHFAGKALQKGVSKMQKVEDPTARRIFLALLSAVAYLHEMDIIHRDIKADNVLVSDDFSDLRLIDFNTSRRVAEGETPLTMTGTRSWSAPEVLLGACPGKPNDVWGIGLCLHFMLFGYLPCTRKDLEFDPFFLNCLNSFDGKHVQAVSKECEIALRCCLEVDLAMRAEANAFLKNNPFNTPVIA